MKQILKIMMIFIMIFNLIMPITVFAVGDGNIDSGGGGMGDLKGNFSFNYESIMFATNGKHQIRGKRDGSVWQIGKCKQEYSP